MRKINKLNYFQQIIVNKYINMIFEYNLRYSVV